MVNVVFTGQRKCLTGLARPGGPTDAVDIIFRILGQIVIDHMADIFNMNAAGGNVGGHQNFDPSIFELFHQPKPFALGKITGNSFRRPSVSLKPVGEPFHPDLGVDKNKRPTPIFTF